MRTLSAAAISGTSIGLPLKENDEVRAATLSCGVPANTFRISSEMPSEKYSLSGSPDMLMKGSTAIELSETTAVIPEATPGCSSDAVAGDGTSFALSSRQKIPPPTRNSSARVASC